MSGVEIGPIAPGLRRLYSPIVLGASQASVSFGPTIPQNFSALMLVALVRGDMNNTNVGINVQFNGDTGSNYIFENFYVAGAATGEAGSIAQNFIFVGAATGATAPANAFTVLEAKIPFYTSTVAHKGLVASSGQRVDTTTSGIYTHRPAGFWLSTAPITSMTIFPGSGNLVAGSSFVLYGLA
jgi:hypothetical protein